MNCPFCDAPCVVWSAPSLLQFGFACPPCHKFYCDHFHSKKPLMHPLRSVSIPSPEHAGIRFSHPIPLIAGGFH